MVWAMRALHADPTRRPASRLGALAVLLVLAPPPARAAGDGNSGQQDSYVPAFALPTEGGGARSGDGGSTRIEPSSEGVSAARVGVTMDLPEWLGKETGWWKTPPPAEQASKVRHVTMAPYITVSPVIGTGF